MAFESLKSLWQKKENFSFNESLSPSFKTLMHMKNDVPYLKDFNFKKTTHQTGDSHSAFKGRGIEFEEVRAYQFGDDVRDIDWRVTARKNQPFTKLYTEEKDREVYVWLDLSEKMYFGTKESLKSVSASKAAALIGWLALSYKDRFGLSLYTGKRTYLFEAKRNQEYFLSILKKIETEARANLTPQKQTEKVEKSLQYFERKTPRDAIVFLIGSFDTKDEEVIKQISLLAHEGEVYLVDIYDKLEAVCPPTGEYLAEFEGSEERIQNFDKKYELAYEAYFESKRRKVKDFCIKTGIHYRAVRTDLPLYSQLRPI
ncbi:MAG: DUF58 domain-containing protein [Alphaproteobacteria bacterium]|nr:DUF58 domain-containing protein [Alphaproteobacteria bacterium]